MLGAIWGFITALPTIVSAITQLIGLANVIRKAFQTDPVDQQKKANDEQKDAENKAGQTDDTSGLFGGGTK